MRIFLQEQSISELDDIRQNALNSQLWVFDYFSDIENQKPQKNDVFVHSFKSNKDGLIGYQSYNENKWKPIYSKPGKLFSQLFYKYDPLFIDMMVKDYNSFCNRKLNGNIIIRSSDEIKKTYLSKSYIDGNGSLQKSCMRYDRTQPFLDLYVELGLKIACILDTSGKVKARALIWTTEQGYKVMDRIYYTQEYDVNYFIGYAKKNKMVYRFNKDLVYENEPFTEKLTIDLNQIDTEFWPYLDTFYYWDYKTNKLSNKSFDNRQISFILCNTYGFCCPTIKDNKNPIDVDSKWLFKVKNSIVQPLLPLMNSEQIICILQNNYNVFNHDNINDDIINEVILRHTEWIDKIESINIKCNTASYVKLFEMIDLTPYENKITLENDFLMLLAKLLTVLPLENNNNILLLLKKLKSMDRLPDFFFSYSMIKKIILLGFKYKIPLNFDFYDKEKIFKILFMDLDFLVLCLYYKTSFRIDELATFISKLLYTSNLNTNNIYINEKITNKQLLENADLHYKINFKSSNSYENLKNTIYKTINFLNI